MTYKGEEVKIVKNLQIADKQGNWIQIEYLDGEKEGMRMPVPKQKLK